MNISLILIGLGPMGREIAGAALKKPGVEITGAVDPAPELTGVSLKDLLSDPYSPDIKVFPTTEALFSSGDFRNLNPVNTVAIVATSSRLSRMENLLSSLFRMGVSVVSTCEEMSFPLPSTEDIWNRLDTEAKKNGVSAAGTGINPGFIMDLLPLTLTASCTKIDSIAILRRLDVRRRRISFRQKMGTGVTAKEFEEKRRQGIILGHSGLEVSLRLIAAGLGWPLEAIQTSPLTPLFSGDSAQNEAAAPPPQSSSCRVSGISQAITGICADGKMIELKFIAAEDPEEYDSIVIEGEPGIRLAITPGIQGDKGTAAMVLNTVHGVINAAPGLHTMLDLPPPGFSKAVQY